MFLLVFKVLPGWGLSRLWPMGAGEFPYRCRGGHRGAVVRGLGAKERFLADKREGLPPETIAQPLERRMECRADYRCPLGLSDGDVGLRPGAGRGARRRTGSAASLRAIEASTRGLDYRCKAKLVTRLAVIAADRAAITVASHEVEFVAQLEHRITVLAEGGIVADGPARAVVCHSSVFAPQVARIFAPHALLSVDEVTSAMAGSQ